MRLISLKNSTLRRPITFLKSKDIEVVVLAQLGAANNYIAQRTGLSPGQVQYRLTKAKNAEGYAPYTSYRTEWRNGASAIYRDVARTFLRPMKAEVKDTLPQLV